MVSPHLSRQVEVITQVLDALVGEAPVVVAPGEVLLHIPPRLQALWRETQHFTLGLEPVVLIWL